MGNSFPKNKKNRGIVLSNEERVLVDANMEDIKVQIKSM